ncbi:MFS transporter [Sungkyunkwania multivorans]|uniref:MFS transporter n=1 Tax=Sungkyunkwania multivorans TaxID=1173618 RepID=A0ABW3CXR1_9FLAO
MVKLLNRYAETFSGLSKEVWWLSLITLVNRAGAMVIPFLSLYLTDDLQFTKAQVGWIMTSFGVGSFFGSWLGGKLCDIIGYYKVILGALIFTGVGFFVVQQLHTFWSICIGFFLLITVADAARPAFFVALSAYSKPENKTRSLTLIRLAINLGFSAGPAVGGLIIAFAGYAALFWIDGITCIIAGLILIQTLHPKKARVLDKEKVVEQPVAPQSDLAYVIFLVALAIFGFIFVQYFSTMPLYYKEIHSLSEENIGLLLAMNGALIFLFEMPLIAYIERKKWSSISGLINGLVLTGVSFLMLLITPWTGILILGMAAATLGEMIAFPLGNKFALDRSKKGRQGAYMGLYSMSFAVAHIFGHNAGMQMAQAYGFDLTWLVMIGFTGIGFVLLIIVKKMLAAESKNKSLYLNTK